MTGQVHGTDETTRRLTLLRHAKSDWPDVPDHDRPLAKRGRRDAPRIGRWLRAHGYVPDVVICSTALRTRQTWDLVAPELNGSPEVRFEPRAYAASPLTLLYLCRELPAPCHAALLIAHNPGIEELAASLDGAQERAGLRFPTAAVAVYEFTGAWSDLAPGQANLLDYTIPADLLRGYAASFAWSPPSPGTDVFGDAEAPAARSARGARAARKTATSHPATDDTATTAIRASCQADSAEFG